MSDASAPAGDGGGSLSGDQFGDVTGTTDIPPTNTAQNPGTGIFGFGWYPFGQPQARRRKHRHKHRRN
jgi:hypothetical protein